MMVISSSCRNINTRQYAAFSVIICIMKFHPFSVFSTLLLATTGLAQSAYISYPTDGSTIQRGTNITVMVEKPDTLVGSTDISIVIGLENCFGDASTCPPPVDDVGQLLYYGPYNPQFVHGPGPNLPPYQNFTVYVPTDQPTGTSLLGLTHLVLVGLGPYVMLDFANVTVNVV